MYNNLINCLAEKTKQLLLIITIKAITTEKER